AGLRRRGPAELRRRRHPRRQSQPGARAVHRDLCGHGELLIKPSLPLSPIRAAGPMVRLAATLLGARVALHDNSIRLGAVLALAAAGAAWPLPGLAQQNAPGLLVSPTYVLLD